MTLTAPSDPPDRLDRSRRDAGDAACDPDEVKLDAGEDLVGRSVPVEFFAVEIQRVSGGTVCAETFGQVVDQFDTNSDGMLDYGEFASLLFW